MCYGPRQNVTEVLRDPAAAPEAAQELATPLPSGGGGGGGGGRTSVVQVTVPVTASAPDADGNVTLTAAIGVDGALPSRFDAVLTIEGVRTTDDREIAPNALTWRTLPIPLTNALNTGSDHYGAVIGAIETVERIKVGETYELRASGSFDLGSEAGQEAARLVAEQMKRWVSIDLEVLSVEYVEEGDCDALYDPDATIDEIIEAMETCHIIERVTSGRVMGAAIVAFAAFPTAVIVPEGAEIPAATDDGRPRAVTASVYTAPEILPARWFADQALPCPTPVFATREGHVVGHLAQWGVCHTGYSNECILAPHSQADYAFFLTGRITAQDDDGNDVIIRVGQLTMGCGHADLHLRHHAAAAHYDGGPGALQVADVAVYEDEWGIVCTGALRSGLTAEEIRAFNAQALSGDWRDVGNYGLELIAGLVVPVPGFPIVAAGGGNIAPPKTRVYFEGSTPLSLVAAGRVTRETTSRRLSRLERRVQQLHDLATPLRAARNAELMEKIMGPDGGRAATAPVSPATEAGGDL